MPPGFEPRSSILTSNTRQSRQPTTFVSVANRRRGQPPTRAGFQKYLAIEMTTPRPRKPREISFVFVSRPLLAYPASADDPVNANTLPAQGSPYQNEISEKTLAPNVSGIDHSEPICVRHINT